MFCKFDYFFAEKKSKYQQCLTNTVENMFYAKCIDVYLVVIGW
jgi:hypothetical protein